MSIAQLLERNYYMDKHKAAYKQKLCKSLITWPGWGFKITTLIFCLIIFETLIKSFERALKCKKVISLKIERFDFLYVICSFPRNLQIDDPSNNKRITKMCQTMC